MASSFLSNIEISLETITKEYLSPRIARSIKLFLSYPRFYGQLLIARRNFKNNIAKYPQNILVIVGLPKSGTTWLEAMLCEFPGFSIIHPPEVTYHETKTGGSHDLPLSQIMFSRLKNTLSVVKVHSPYSLNNIDVLHQSNVKYVFMHRDLRDVAVSYYHFVKQRPWHPEFKIYDSLSIRHGLQTFADSLLMKYMAWIRDWYSSYDKKRGFEIRYERLVNDTENVFSEIVNHFEIPHTYEEIENIVSMYKIKSNIQVYNRKLSSTHLRKGVVGDWSSHFTPELKRVYKEKIGDFLIEFGYERDLNW